jgi:hypothetical protein
MSRSPSILLLALALVAAPLLVPRDAHAYVDPGIVAVLFQYIYVAVFGLLTLLFVRPVRMVKNAFRRLRTMLGGRGERG